MTVQFVFNPFTNTLDAVNPASTASGVTSVTASDTTVVISPTLGAVLVRRAAITGDVAIAQASNTSVLATVNANVGSFTYASFTVNAKGLVTAASSGTAPLTSITSVDGSLGVSDNDLCINPYHSNNWHCIQCFYPSNDNQTAVDIMGYSVSQVSPLFTIQHFCGGGCDIRAAIYEDGHSCFCASMYVTGTMYPTQVCATCGIVAETVNATLGYYANGTQGCTGTISLVGLTNIQVDDGLVTNWS